MSDHRWLVHYDGAGEIHQVSHCSIVTTFNDLLVAEIPSDHLLCSTPLEQGRFRVSGVENRDGDIALAILEETTPATLADLPRPRFIN